MFSLSTTLDFLVIFDGQLFSLSDSNTDKVEKYVNGIPIRQSLFFE
jgi:hypothetical protein